jgi:hypothetical protein
MAAGKPSFGAARDGSEAQRRRLTIIGVGAGAAVAYVSLILLFCGGAGGGGAGGLGSDGLGDGSGTQQMDGAGRGAGVRDTTATETAPPEDIIPEEPEPQQPVVVLQQKERPPTTPVVAGQSGGGTAGAGGGRGGGQGGGQGPGTGPRSMGTGDISFRIYWTPRVNDVDLHVVDPQGHHIWYSRKNCPCKGCLDVDDQNSGGPENIFWPRGEGPHGNYTFYAVYYKGTGVKQVTIEVRRGEEIVDTKRFILNTEDETSAKFTHRLD